MRTLYIDAFSGVSGDMMLGALLDLGADEHALREGIAGLGLSDEVRLDVTKAARSGIVGTAARVYLLENAHHSHDHDHNHSHDHNHNHSHEHGHNHSHDRNHADDAQLHAAHRGLPEIERIIRAAHLKDAVTHRALEIFRRLGEAEAAVHGVALEQVHFHEVGAADAMVDIIGCCILLDSLGVEQVTCSPLSLGGGTVKCAHGILPVPAPATARLLSGIPAYGGDAGLGELTTPTGAAIVASLSERFGPAPMMRMEKQGFGFGQRDTGSLNALRLLLGESTAQAEDVYELRANLDDMTGEEVSFAAERLFEAGAVDVWTQSIMMKKGRVGVMLCAMAKEARLNGVLAAYMAHTSAWGVRYERMRRHVADCAHAAVQTAYGEIRVKSGGDRRKPEYEDCADASRKHDVPIRDVVHAALSAPPGENQ